jgi:hypothetical protein
MDLGAIQGPKVKITRTPPSKHKTHLSLVLHAIKEAKSTHVFGSRIALPVPSFPDGGFMDLSIIPSHHLDEVARARGFGCGMTTDAASVSQMGLL